MPITCPKCYSEQVEAKNYARKTGSAIGITAGAARAISCAEIGASAGKIIGPRGRIAGAVLGGLIGGVAGYATGATLGEVVDDNVLDNYHCLSCRYHFSRESR